MSDKTDVETIRKFSDLHPHLLKVTQMAAISARRAAGHGDNKLADQAAVTSMREQLASIGWITAVVKIGEGERDEAPMLYIGEKIGNGRLHIDIAVDPLENTNATAKLGPNAICVLAAAPSGGLINASDGYMNKLIVGPKVAHKVDIRNSVETNIDIIAKALRREVDDLTITVLDRKPRNEDLIERIIKTGASAQVIPDGDLIPGVLSCISGASTHALMGIGGSPEGVISAAAVKLLGGEMQAVFWPKNDDDKNRLISMGIDLEKIYYHYDLALAKDLIFCVTAVTQLGSASKSILDGVSFFGGAAITNSLVLTGNTMQKLHTMHVLDPKEFIDQGSEFRLF